MISIAIAIVSPARRILLAALAASALFTLRAEAQTVAPPCDPASDPAFAIATPEAQSPLQLAAIPCGAASQICCPGGFCNTGLVCNSNGICRTPCGAAGQRCCPNQACDAGLACNSSGICRTCGGNGDICCGGNTCSSGLVCNGGRCAPPCGGYNQPCCNGTCGAFLACAPRINTCIPCGFTGAACCPGNYCSPGTCNTINNLCE
ncbi:MAG: hypothetical protein QOF89_542 [Acidobacteriota bacterium]|jgi:hypothetical protein|nr:hypothetical protein [Acidobacteriota bacterium]